MELPRRLTVRCSNNSKNKEFDIYVSETISILRLQEYITKVKSVEGIYVFKGHYIAHNQYKMEILLISSSTEKHKDTSMKSS